MIAKKIYLGLDPGKSGGWAIVIDGSAVDCGTFFSDPYKFELTRAIDSLAEYINIGDVQVKAIKEKVGVRPKQGIVSAFTFGNQDGELIGRLRQRRIEYLEVSPQKWQSCVFMDREYTNTKSMSLEIARELFPNMVHKLKRKSIDHGVSDALLLAWYGWINNL